jgi:hypothetical protein
MRYVGKDFPLQDPTETEDLAFDFTRHPDWDNRDCLASATIAVTVVVGTDASASSRLNGSPALCEGRVIQSFQNPQDGVKYKLAATATTHCGKVLALYSNVTGQS